MAGFGDLRPLTTRTANVCFAKGRRWARLRNELHDLFGLDENHMVYCGIALGWPDPNEPANKLYAERAPLSEVVEFRSQGAQTTRMHRSRRDRHALSSCDALADRRVGSVNVAPPGRCIAPFGLMHPTWLEIVIL